MKQHFVDTSGWMMLSDSADPGHEDAVAVRHSWLEERGVLVTTDYVMDETLTLLRMRLGLGAARLWWCRSSPVPD